MKIKCPKCKHNFEITTLGDALYNLWDNEDDEAWDKFEEIIKKKPTNFNTREEYIKWVDEQI